MVRRSDIRRLEREIDALREGLRRLTERLYALERGAPLVTEEPVTPEDLAPEAEPAVLKPEGPGWEAVLGGNWLNKAGVLVLVIGLALFLWYSFGRMGPGGRVAVSLAVSAVMLVGGVLLERRDRYRAAARGLIGGGWAALYSTTYAAHAVEAARIIASPTAATLLLAAVAVGMILHSLRYRSQAVTGLSYFAAFATLAISPLSFFAVIALAPLAVSIVYLAHRFRWGAVGLVGLPATYGIYLIHAARSSGGSLAVGQSVLFVYWLVFEMFDVLYAARMRSEPGRPVPMLPLNAAAFVLASLVQWQASSPATLHMLFVLSATAYLGSAALRLVVAPASGFPVGTPLLGRLKGGSYEGALALAAAFTAAASAIKLSGLTISMAFLIEAELLFFAGLYFRQRFLRHLATALLLASVGHILITDVQGAASLMLAGRDWHARSPVILLHAAAFYMNHFLARRGSLHIHMATGLLAVLLAQEVSGSWLTLAWGALGVALLAAGFPLRQRCLRLSGLAMLLVCVGKLLGYDLRYLEMPFRVLSFLVLGVLLIGVSFVYSRFREQISRYL